MSALSHRSCLTIKLSYVLMTAALLLNFISDAHSLNFKFIISAIVILVFCSLLSGVCFTSPADERILKLFIAFLSSLIVTEKIISLSLPAISNIILGVTFIFILSEYMGMALKAFIQARNRIDWYAQK